MKLKHIIFLGVIFLILLGALSAKKFFMKPEIETTEYKSLKISFNPSGIYAIRIKRAENEELLKIEKKDGEWFMPSKWNMRARKEKIDNLIKDISNLRGELRSSSKNVFSDYGISDEEAVSIVMLDKEQKPLQGFLIGLEKAGYGSSFLRKSGSAEVYLVDKDILSLIGLYGDPKEATVNMNNWIDLSITKFDPEKIESIKVTRKEKGRKVVTVDIEKVLDAEKNLKHWVATGKKPIFDIDAKKIRDFLKSVNDINASEAVDPKGENYGFEDPFLYVALEKEKESIELVLGNATEKGGEDRYLRTSEGHVYVLRRYAVNRLNIDISKFFIDNPLRIDADKLQLLTVKSAEKTIVLDKNTIAKNADYIDKIKKFQVEKMLFAEKTQGSLKTPSEYSIEIEKQNGDIVAIDIEKAKDGIFLAQLRGTPEIFTISKNVFDKIFEGLDKLNLQADASVSSEN